MTDGATNAAQPTAEQAAIGIAPVAPDSPTIPLPPPADERPELAVGAAFAGGLAIALLLKRLAR
jgi:hypothetical protein